MNEKEYRDMFIEENMDQLMKVINNKSFDLVDLFCDLCANEWIEAAKYMIVNKYVIIDSEIFTRICFADMEIIKCIFDHYDADDVDDLLYEHSMEGLGYSLFSLCDMEHLLYYEKIGLIELIPDCHEWHYGLDNPYNNVVIMMVELVENGHSTLSDEIKEKINKIKVELIK